MSNTLIGTAEQVAATFGNFGQDHIGQCPSPLEEAEEMEEKAGNLIANMFAHQTASFINREESFDVLGMQHLASNGANAAGIRPAPPSWYAKRLRVNLEKVQPVWSIHLRVNEGEASSRLSYNRYFSNKCLAALFGKDPETLSSRLNGLKSSREPGERTDAFATQATVPVAPFLNMPYSRDTVNANSGSEYLANVRYASSLLWTEKGVYRLLYETNLNVSASRRYAIEKSPDFAFLADYAKNKNPQPEKGLKTTPAMVSGKALGVQGAIGSYRAPAANPQLGSSVFSKEDASLQAREIAQKSGEPENFIIDALNYNADEMSKVAAATHSVNTRAVKAIRACLLEIAELRTLNAVLKSENAELKAARALKRGPQPPTNLPGSDADTVVYAQRTESQGDIQLDVPESLARYMARVGPFEDVNDLTKKGLLNSDQMFSLFSRHWKSESGVLIAKPKFQALLRKVFLLQNSTHRAPVLRAEPARDNYVTITSVKCKKLPNPIDPESLQVLEPENPAFMLSPEPCIRFQVRYTSKAVDFMKKNWKELLSRSKSGLSCAFSEF